MTPIRVRPLGLFARVADLFMVPIMYAVSGTLNEVPQRTHRWNNTKFKTFNVGELNSSGLVECNGMGKRRWYEPLVFHIPILGGWKNYVVLRPRNPYGEWHVGWVVNGKAGISRVRLKGAVRMLVGPDTVIFFGIDTRTGTQRFIHNVGTGCIGRGGPYTQLPLL